MLFVFLSIACKPDMILVSMYLFMLNKLCLSLSLSLSIKGNVITWWHHCMNCYLCFVRKRLHQNRINSPRQGYMKMAPTLGLYSLSGKTSYRKISWSLEAARFGFKLFQSLWNLAGTSAALLPRCLSNFRAIRPLQHPISWLRDFTRFGGKASYRLVNRGPAKATFGTIVFLGW